MVVTTGAEMSDAVVRLDELADPMAFLTGARVPLTHLWPVPFRAVEWVVDRILIDAQLGPRFDFIRPETVIMLGLDCSDPDVARWVDRQISGRLARHKFAWATLAFDDGFFEVFWGTRRVIGQCGVDHMIGEEVPRNESGMPTARASLLRTFFGRRDV
jgi:hypothetical protein